MEEDYYATSRNGHELKDMYNPEANTLDIRSNGLYPSGVLSNLCSNSFRFDGMVCGSMEGKAYMVYGSDSIVAPSGYKLTIAVKPCLSFWQSDLHGGFYIFHVTMEPKRKDLQNYKVCRFADYLPSMESEYRNGRIVKTVWHHDPCIESDDKDLVFIPIITDDLNVYSVTWEDGSKHQRVYKDGLLAYKQEISKYGTALKKETYSFLSDKKVKVTFETIDYKTKALKTISTSVMNVPNMEKFREDMNVISGNYRWENYYNK